jgi:hypothetical protein
MAKNSLGEVSVLFGKTNSTVSFIQFMKYLVASISLIPFGTTKQNVCIMIFGEKAALLICCGIFHEVDLP